MLTLSQRLATAPLGIQERLALIADTVVPPLADWCVLDVMASPDEPRLVVIRHADPAAAPLIMGLRQHYSPNPLAPFGVADVLWDGEPRQYAHIDADLLADVAVDASHVQALIDLDLRSCLSVPVPGEQRPIGVMTWATTGSRHALDDEHRSLAVAAAGLIASSLEGARQVEVARCDQESQELAKDRLQRLQTVSMALATALTVEAVGEAVRTTILPALRARIYCLALSDTQGRLTPVSWQGLPDDPTIVQVCLAGDSPLGDAFRSGEAVYVEDRPRLCDAYPKATTALAGSRTEAIVAMPLQAQGRRLGAIALGFDQPKRFSEADRRFVEAVADQCATALVRAQVFAARQQEARERESLLATLAHDLKNPLTVIQMHTYMMRQGSDGDRQRADAIQQASDRILHLVENLQDLTRSGPAPLAPQPLAPQAWIEGALLDAQPLLQSKRLRVEITRSEELPPVVHGDGERLQRALVNVLDHQARRAPMDGLLHLSLQALPLAGMRLTVCTGDPGPVDAGADEGPEPTLDLELTVARVILESHGGRLRIARSQAPCVQMELPGP